MTSTPSAENLASLYLAGRSTELDYLDLDAQCDALDRAAFLGTCEADELADAAEFFALVIAQ